MNYSYNYSYTKTAQHGLRYLIIYTLAGISVALSSYYDVPLMSLLIDLIPDWFQVITVGTVIELARNYLKHRWQIDTI